MRWWGRSEQRAGEGDYTEKTIARAEALASGRADAGELLVTAACVGLWERGLSAATVEPASAPLMPVRDARLLAVMGRSLALTGNFVGVIRVADGVVALIPASAYDLTGGASPASWVYRLDLAGPSTSHTESMPGDAVLHVRIGADARQPWRGRSPLQSSPKTTALASRIEASLTAEATLPVGRIAVIEAVPEQVKAYGNDLVQGGIISFGLGALRVHGQAQAPTSRLEPARYGPEPNAVMESLRQGVGVDISNAYGVPPVLFDPRSDGSARREAWRQFWLGTVAPVGALIQGELRDKLDGAAVVSFDALAAADVDARSRAVARRAAAYATLRGTGMQDDEARQFAGLEV